MRGRGVCVWTKEAWRVDAVASALGNLSLFLNDSVVPGLWGT